jgi:hypothetical protein
MKSMRIVVAVLLVCLMAGYASAQLIVDTAQMAATGRVEGGTVFCLSEVEYDVEAGHGIGGSADVQRSILGGYAALGLSDELAVYGALGLILNSEIDGSSDSGSGFMLAGGGRLDLMDVSVVDVSVYGQLGFVSEDYGEGADGTIVEVVGGVVGRIPVNDQVNVFGAVDLFPFSDGEVDVDGVTTDIGRDGLFGIRGGATIDLGSVWLRGEIAVVGETTVTIGAGTYF